MQASPPWQPVVTQVTGQVTPPSKAGVARACTRCRRTAAGYATISLPPDTALYLREKPNASAVVAESVEIYRARELERELGAAYRADASEAEDLNREWASADAKVKD